MTSCACEKKVRVSVTARLDYINFLDNDVWSID
jgi:hypothetical protein